MLHYSNRCICTKKTIRWRWAMFTLLMPPPIPTRFVSIVKVHLYAHDIDWSVLLWLTSNTVSHSLVSSQTSQLNEHQSRPFTISQRRQMIISAFCHPNMKPEQDVHPRICEQKQKHHGHISTPAMAGPSNSCTCYGRASTHHPHISTPAMAGPSNSHTSKAASGAKYLTGEVLLGEQ